eukprot:CAMPEP_0173438392 /NCGR_PEP_ID=MMETSP1357-20121228/20235_1 /TAXON_ID=77926 /ORGANISM="Hemiselmis rufescens, Strain PCC563" /LENGTH=206 /DNA_ID=CAMNT_0014403681 /DNA_START=47 /DNA_END=667 /DNA_ORIENTATION=-
MAVLYIVYAKEHNGEGSLKWYVKNWDGRWWQALWMSFVALVPLMIAAGNVGSEGTGGNVVMVSSLLVSILALLTIWSRQVVQFVGTLRVDEEDDEEEEEEEDEEIPGAVPGGQVQPAKEATQPFGYAQYRQLQDNMRPQDAAGGMPVFRAAARAFGPPVGKGGVARAMMQMGRGFGAPMQQRAGQAGAATNTPPLQQQGVRHDKVW